MNRKVLILLSAALLLSAASLTAQTRAAKPNDFTIELGGKALLYSLGYSRILSPNFALEAGVSFLGGSSSEGDTVSAFLLSGGARLYLLKKDASPYLSGGVCWVAADTDAGPFDGESGVFFYASPGFEYRAQGGFVFRGGVYFLIKDGFFVWPGVSLGVAF
jgi:hypothetical protein